MWMGGRRIPMNAVRSGKPGVYEWRGGVGPECESGSGGKVCTSLRYASVLDPPTRKGT